MGDLKNLIIDASSGMPAVDFNPITGDLILSGRSIPENAFSLFDPIYKWVLKYIKDPAATTNLRLNLEYFNTASSIWIAKIAKALCQIDNQDCLLIVHLYFGIQEFEEMENDDLEEVLSPFADMLGSASLSVGIKIYGTDKEGTIVKENMILI